MDDKSNREDSADRRTDHRLFVNTPVEITNLDGVVDRSAEEVVIEDVSDFGCRFSMHGPVQEGDAIAIQLLDQGGTSMADVPVKFFEVKWVTRGIEIATVGARIVEGDKLAACQRAMENRGSVNSGK